jgi:carbon monoxide dehydrogenase subunit G
MQLAQSFEVAAPIDRVWRALIDIEHVAPCLPGAVITGRADDGSYEGSFTVKIGPTSASYSGRLQMLEVDESSHRAMMQASGTDRRGQGGASATIVSKLSETLAGGTHVEVQTDYRITGRLARFGRGGMIEDISGRLLREFGDRLAASLTPDVPVARGGPIEHDATASEEGAPSGSLPASAVIGATDAAGQESSAPTDGYQASEPPDVGRLATEALLARLTRNWAQIAMVGAAAIFLMGAWRQRRWRRLLLEQMRRRAG